MAEQSTNPKADLPPPPPANKDDATPPPVVAAAPVDKVDPPPSASKENEPPANPPPPAPASKEDLPPAEAAGDTKAAAIKDKEEPPPPQAPPTEPEAGEENRSLGTMMEKEGSSPQLPPQETKAEVVAEAEAETEAAKAKADPKIPQNLVSFKEESNVVADLSDSERDALKKLKELVREALNNHQFTSPAPPPPPPKGEEKQTTAATTQEPTSDTTKPEGPAPTSDSDVSTELNPPQPESKLSQEEKTITAAVPDEVSIWGIPLMKDDRSDVILLKFLRAREFKVKDAFTMIKNTIQWRRDFGIDSLMEEDLGDDLEKVVFMHGYDRDGHPVCYNVYGEFENKELYQKTFSDEEKRRKFLRWRIQFLEKSIRKLDFRPGGVNTIFQVNDLRNAPGPGKRELRLATKQALQLLQDNYPEFVAKQVFINVPWWYLAFYTMISPFMTQRTKSKFVFVGPSKTAATLFKYISPEHVPILYGGLSVDYCDCNPEFTIADPVTDLTIKPGTKQTVEIIIYEKCVIVWEIRVVGWEVSYAAEFVPDAKDAYTVIIQKPTKMAPRDEPVVSNRFKVGELGKILLTIDNPTSKKKQLLYRFKIEPFSD